jgi:hypothetical protein
VPGKGTEISKYRTCAFCGEEVKTLNGWRWTYQRNINGHRKAFFCSWSCMVKYDNGAPVNRWAKAIDCGECEPPEEE